MFLKVKSYVAFLIIISSIILLGFSYDDLQLDKEDMKKIEKARKLNQDAQKIIDKANAIYSEIAEQEAGGEDVEKIAKLKEKAISLQIEALGLQKEANFLEHKILLNILPEYKTQYSANKEVPIELNLIEEEVKELFYKAEKLRNEAIQIDDDSEVKLEKLLSAQDYESSGLSKQKELIDIYRGEQEFETKPQVEIKNDDPNFVVNEELLKSYLNYIKSNDTIIPVDIFRKQIYSGNASSEAIRNTWDNYLYTEIAERQEEIASKSAKEQTLDGSDNLAENIIEETITQEKKDGNVDAGRNIDQKIINEQDQYADKSVYADIIFKVQIAADKKKLSQHMLQKIYNGNKKVSMLNEEGWFKYSIGDFETFKLADQFRISLGETDAFVVAYKNGVKVDLIALLRKSRTKKVSPKPSETVSISTKDVIFKVQISAARKKLSNETLADIYNGNEKVDLIEEDNWYKYSIGQYSNYKQAVDLKNSVNVEGAFVVAYKDGKKVSIPGVLKGKLGTENKIVFKIQIAADMEPLSTDKLHEIYSGYKKINKFKESGWYKYSIGEFDSFEEAKKFMSTCGVKGAFIIAFKGDEKVNVLNAKRSTRCYDPVINTDWIKSNTTKKYKVQIAASSKELSEKQLKRICCIEETIFLIQEDSWFKYSIGNYDSFRQAVELKNISGVSDAFIVAYENGKKVNVK